MRKILASFLAAAMVASVGATMTFAASNSSVNLNVNNGLIVTIPAGDSASIDRVELLIKAPGGNVPVVFDVGSALSDTDDAADFSKAIGTHTEKNVNIDGREYDITLKYVGNGSATASKDFVVEFNGKLPATTTVDVVVYVDTTAGVAIAPVPFGVAAPVAGGWSYTTTVTPTNLGVEDDVDSDIQGISSLDIDQVIVCNPQGDPIALTESADGVSKDQNDADGVQSGKTVYFMLKDNYSFNNDDYWKVKIKKSENGKYVKAVSETFKNFGSPLYNVANHEQVAGTGGTGKRQRYIKVELAELYTDDEYKIGLDLRLSARTPAVEKYGVEDDAEIKVNNFSFYMTNLVKSADNDWKVGIGGLMLNPISNDWNEVTYFDEDSDVAYMKFFADSDTGKFYAKLSTKWEHEDYRSYFNDQDAFFFQFTGSPSISSTSRCDLQIYNPFIDEDGNEQIDPETAIIYQLIDGELVNVTDKFTYAEGDNGDMAFTTRTRFLGTYIICEHEVEGLATGDDTTPPTDVAPDDVAPTPVAPDGGSGAKTPPNTGRF